MSYTPPHRPQTPSLPLKIPPCSLSLKELWETAHSNPVVLPRLSPPLEMPQSFTPWNLADQRPFLFLITGMLWTHSNCCMNHTVLFPRKSLY